MQLLTAFTSSYRLKNGKHRGNAFEGSREHKMPFLGAWCPQLHRHHISWTMGQGGKREEREDRHDADLVSYAPPSKVSGRAALVLCSQKS